MAKKMTEAEVFEAMGITDMPEKSDEQIAQEAVEFDKELAADEATVVECGTAFTKREQVERFYGKAHADILDDEEINDALVAMFEQS